MQWIAENWSGVVAVAAASLAVAVAVLHLVHKDDVAAQLQKFEDMISKK